MDSFSITNGISIIIPTFNRYESLKRSFSFLEKSTILPNEVLIIDQSVESGIKEQIQNLCRNSSLNCVYRWLDTPSSTKARNVGIEISNFETLIFMDDDVDIKPDTIKNIQDYFADSRITMIAGINSKEQFHKNSKLGMFFLKSSFLKRYIGHVTKSVYGRFPEYCHQETKTEWAMGFFFAVKKSKLDSWNIMFDEKLKSYAYAEDLDFSYRYFKCSQRENLRTIMTPKVIVQHNVSQEYRTPSKKSIFMAVEHRLYLSHKLFGSRKSELMFVWSTIGDILDNFFHNGTYSIYFKALCYSIIHKKDIFKGIFNYEKM